jgi:hypothetical protein
MFWFHSSAKPGDTLVTINSHSEFRVLPLRLSQAFLCAKQIFKIS